MAKGTIAEGSIDVAKIRGQRAFSTPSGISKFRGLKTYGKAAIAAQAGVGGIGYTQLPDGQYVLETDLQELKREWPKGYEIITSKGLDAYNEAVGKAQQVAEATKNIKKTYESLSDKAKHPKPSVGMYGYNKTPGFDRVVSVSPRAESIPDTPGFYSVTYREGVEGKQAPTSLREKMHRETASGQQRYINVDYFKEYNYVYARLKDGSLVLVKESTGYTASGREPSSGGLTHEQKMGAQKLAPELATRAGKDYAELPSKDKKKLYQQALGLVSASGYYDPDAIVQVGPYFVSPYGPAYSGKTSTGEPVWGAYTPEVASAIKKLKPFQKADGSYDWTKIITEGTTPQIIAASRTSGLLLADIKGVKYGIDNFPELKTALAKGGWEGYETKVKELMADKKLWEQKLEEEFPDYYKIYKEQGEKEFLDAVGDFNTKWDIYSEYINKGWVVPTEDGGISPDLFQILINNKKATGVYANDINKQKLLDIGYSEDEITKAEKYLDSLPKVYSDYIGQYGSDTFQEAAKTGNLPYSSSGWNVPKTTEAIQDLKTFLQNMFAKITKNVKGALGDTFGAKATIMLSGAGLNLATMPGMLALQLEQGFQAPQTIQPMAVEMAKGIGESFITVLSPRKAITAFNTVPFEFGGQVLTVALIVQPFLGPALRGGQFIKTVAKGDYVPLRSMSMEASTARVPFTAKQLAKMRKAGVSEADIIRAGTELNEQLVKGVKVAKVELGGVVVKIKNIAYLRENPLSVFNSTPDISLVERGGYVPVYKELYGAAKAAIEPMERSYLEGQRAVKPGILEIRIIDPDILGKIMPQKRLISGGKTLEPETVLPSLDQLQGWGYYLEPIPGKLGRGSTFDAYLGEVAIRRFTLRKVIDNPAGLVQIRLGKGGNGGVVAIGDLHGTPNFKGIFDDINSGFADRVLDGNPTQPSTWHWVKSTAKDRTVVIMGDSIDRGPMYGLLRDTFNRLYDEAKTSGDRFERLMGNHELAYLAKDAIKGVKYTDKGRISIKAGILEDIKAGKVKAAIEADNKLFTHAGVSKGVFPEYKGKSAKFIAKDLNTQVLQAIRGSNFKGKIFAKGRVEKGNSLLKNERSQGGIFWLRPQEATAAQLNLGYEQIVGHNPGFGIRRIWNDNFIETDVGRRQGKTGAYVDTPNIRTIEGDIITESLGGKAPNLSSDVLIKLKLKAIRDTVADFFVGWDGRIQAIQKLKANHDAVKAMAKSLDQQIKERKAAGDSIGVKFLKRQKSELLSSTGSDYLYGGIALWRDIVMGRQNSVKILGNARNMTKAQLVTGLRLANITRARLTRFSDYDLQQLFGYKKADIERMLDTKGIDIKDYATARDKVAERLANLRDIVDRGLDRTVVDYLDRDAIITRYRRVLDENIRRLYETEEPYEYVYAPRATREIAERRPLLMLSYLRMPYVREVAERRPVARRPVGRVPAARVPAERVPAPRVPTIRVPPPPPPPPPPPTPGVPPPTLSRAEAEKGVTKKGYEGAVAWAQGQLKRGNKLVTGYRVWRYPYRQADLEYFDQPDLPPGIKIVPGADEAFRTVQQYRGKVSPAEGQFADIGEFLVFVKQPGVEPGKEGAIAFVRDTKEARAKIRGVRGESPEALKKMPVNTTLTQLVTGNYDKEKISDKDARRLLTEVTGKMKPQVIASELTKLGASKAQIEEALRHLPDRERKAVELWMAIDRSKAPIKRVTKVGPVYLQPKKLRQKKTKKKSGLFPMPEDVTPSITLGRV